jgi:hypothetical protein
MPQQIWIHICKIIYKSLNYQGNKINITGYFKETSV